MSCSIRSRSGPSPTRSRRYDGSSSCRIRKARTRSSTPCQGLSVPTNPTVNVGTSRRQADGLKRRVSTPFGTVWTASGDADPSARTQSATGSLTQITTPA
jgi:hypothetical protein